MDGTFSLSLLPRQSLPLAQAQRQWEAMGTALLALLALWGRGLLELVTAEGRELMIRDQCSTGFWGAAVAKATKDSKKLVHVQVH